MRHFHPGQNTDANTILGDKIISCGSNLDSSGWPITDYRNEMVLRTSSQCLPMIRYDKAMVANTGREGLRSIGYLYAYLISIINKLFNEGATEKKVALPPLLNPASQIRPGTMPQLPPSLGLPPTFMPLTHAPNLYPSKTSITNVAAVASAALRPTRGAAQNVYNSFGLNAQYCTLNYAAPQKLNSNIDSAAFKSPTPSCNLSEDCAICMESLSSSRCKKIVSCGHIFHDDCLKKALRSSSSCPICRKASHVVS